MFRGLLKLVLIVIVVVAVGAFALGYWSFDRMRGSSPIEKPVATTGHVDVDKARQTGAEIGEKTAVAAERAKSAIEDGALTAKIKSKMALDDTLKSRGIDVSTDGGVVTLSGAVSSAAEHERALQLARETTGVTSVRDRLRVR
jgi:hyperosmotically inducible periplasmic protein